MKHIFTILRFYGTAIFLAVLFTGCFETSNEISIELTVSQNSMTFPSAGGEQIFSINSNTNNWTVSSNATSWITISSVNGSKNGEVKITVASNNTSSSRLATITTSGTGVQEKLINVTQMADPTVFGSDIIAAYNFGNGNGAANNPFLIQNAEQLKKLVNDVNNGNTYFDTYFKLMTDIVVTAEEWIPIGNDYGILFKGVFDGNSHIISGTLKSSKYRYFGFFGFLGSGAHIANLTIAASVYNEGDYASNTEEVYSGTGAISGRSIDANMTIRNCNITGSVVGANANSTYTGGVLGVIEGGVIQNCSVSDNTITGGWGKNNGWSETGGITGIVVKGEIVNCEVFSSTKITGGDAYALSWCRTGGIAGENQDRITLCTNHAEVSGIGMVGGITGFNHVNSEIHTSLNTGNLSGYLIYCGGLAGYNNEGKIYPCCSNLGMVNNQTADSSNQIGSGNSIETSCPEGHSKR